MMGWDGMGSGASGSGPSSGLNSALFLLSGCRGVGGGE